MAVDHNEGPGQGQRVRPGQGLDERTARRHLSHFAQLGLVSRLGLARLTEYEVL